MRSYSCSNCCVGYYVPPSIIGNHDKWWCTHCKLETEHDFEVDDSNAISLYNKACSLQDKGEDALGISTCEQVLQSVFFFF